MHTHLGEGENQTMVDRWGKRTLDWCEEIGFAGPDVWYAHCWELSMDEFRRMAKAGTGVSHCPAPAVLGGFPILPIRKMIEAGVPISLGVDGSATNDSSNLLDALRMAYLMQCYFSKERGGSASAYDMLKIATVGGAKMLGRQELGSLENGKGADLFMIDAETLELTGTEHDPRSVLARAGVTGPVYLTMINGKVVYRDGQLQGVDERRLRAEGEEVCTRVLREPHAAFHNLF
ncbi:MAG: amidohydrolase family protein [Clostridia bacterium]|nr:amidohydrolase family protein [Clostridia bacterium]